MTWHMAPESCPECGAPIRTLACRERLDLLLAWEWEDEQLRALHFLTVASFNLQHPSPFTDEAITGLQAAFRGYLDGDLTIADIRRGAAALNGSQRVRRAVPARGASAAWTMTIDAVAQPDQPSGAAARVRAWAQAIRRDLG